MVGGDFPRGNLLPFSAIGAVRVVMAGRKVTSTEVVAYPLGECSITNLGLLNYLTSSVTLYISIGEFNWVEEGSIILFDALKVVRAEASFEYYIGVSEEDGGYNQNLGTVCL